MYAFNLFNMSKEAKEYNNKKYVNMTCVFNFFFCVHERRDREDRERQREKREKVRTFS